jgi:hypothetical protein
MTYTKEMNDGKHCFVFGSNLAGKHGKGAAKDALLYWGAKYGVGFGLTGNSYAIPTKGHDLDVLPIGEIESRVERFIGFAAANPKITFLVTAIGCGLAGYSPKDIAPMFKNAPRNCVLPEEFK